MTIAIGVRFSDYVLLAADTRVTQRDIHHKARDHTDDNEKIYRTNIGIATGAGDVDLIARVNDRLKQIDEIIDTDLLLEMADEERDLYRSRFPPILASYVEEDIEKTGWIFSYVTYDKEAPAEWPYALRVALIHPSGNIIGSQRLPNNCPIMIAPLEANQEEADDISMSLNDLIKPSEQFKTAEESIQYHGFQIADLIQTIALKYDSISRCCQIGAHTLDGRKGISAVVKPGDTEVSICLTRPI
jgi:hypothetical protein